MAAQSKYAARKCHMRTKRVLPPAVPFLVLLFFESQVSAQRHSDWRSARIDDWEIGLYGGIFMVLLWIFVIAGLIFIIKWLVQSTTEAPGGQSSSAFDVLQIPEERYARGVIDKQQFQETKRDILL
jgi:putative membrane protein